MFAQKTIFQLKNIITIIISLSLVTTMDIPEDNNSNNSSGAIPKIIKENPQRVDHTERNYLYPELLNKFFPNKTEKELCDEAKEQLNHFNKFSKIYEKYIEDLKEMKTELENMKIKFKRFDPFFINSFKQINEKKRNEIIKLEQRLRPSFFLQTLIKFMLECDSSIHLPEEFKPIKEELDELMEKFKKYIKEINNLLDYMENLITNEEEND